MRSTGFVEHSSVRSIRRACAALALVAFPLLAAQASAQVDAVRLVPSAALSGLKASTLHGHEALAYGTKGHKAADGRTTTSSTVSVGIPGVDSVQNWSDQFVSPGYDGLGNPQSVWPYTMVGNPPEYGQSTTIGAPIVPVNVQLLAADGSVAYTFGPSAADIGNVIKSPIFQPFPYASGTGQFLDEMMRTQFARRFEQGEDGGYHTLLTAKLRTGRVMQVPYLTPTGANAWYVFVNKAGQAIAAAIDEGTFGNLLFPATYPVTPDTPIGAAEASGDITTRDISTFLFKDTVLFSNGDINQCCIIGYHTYDYEPGDASNGNNLRFYVLNYASYLSTGLFSGGFEDITPWSHEMAEIFDDPFVNNATPWWLIIDPSTGYGNCQNNLEVGDVIEVLSSVPVYQVGMNGLTYHPQNMALLSWFAGQTPAQSASRHGAYSFPDETTVRHLSPAPLLPGCVAPPTP